PASRLIILYNLEIRKGEDPGQTSPQIHYNIFIAFTSNYNMKKLAILLLISLTIFSCRFPDGSISIKHSQYDHYYEMTAKFNPKKTDEVDRYLDKELTSDDMSFVKTEN